MTEEHLSLARALDVPIVIVVTKTDIASPQQIQRTITDLTQTLTQPGYKRVSELCHCVGVRCYVSTQSSLVVTVKVLLQAFPHPVLGFTHRSELESMCAGTKSCVVSIPKFTLTRYLCHQFVAPTWIPFSFLFSSLFFSMPLCMYRKWLVEKA